MTQTIDRPTLLKIARDTAAQRMAARPSLAAAFLIGSVAAQEPILGQATDIDLILVDSGEPLRREVLRLTDQVVLDVQYRSRDDYANPKNLRAHPWLGPELFSGVMLVDPTHLFDLAQASARGQFFRPDFVAARARACVALARQALHIGWLPGQEPSAPVTLADFCAALQGAANAALSLTGLPAGGRRLVMRLEAAARQLDRPDVYEDFLGLFGGPELEAGQAQRLLADWDAAYRAGQTSDDELIHPARRSVYERGFQAQIEADRAAESLWLMLTTWQAAIRRLPGDSPLAEPWAGFLERLGLGGPAEFRGRVAELQAYVEAVTVLVEAWADSNGA